ncbi:MAG: hypothetical protein R2734_18015 [Nocardioides sp.]
MNPEADSDPARRRGSQGSYAGHVWFGSAELASDAKIRTKRVKLTPMGSPKPGSGMFYLEHGNVSAKPEPGEVLSHWGSSIDASPRRIRGRKFYWHSDPDGQQEQWHARRPRHEASATQQRRSGMEARDATLVEGAVVECTITFDQLSPLALQTLLLALDPAPLLRLVPAWQDTPAEFGTHLGGGKPLGLGTAVATEVACEATTLAERYAAGAGWRDVNPQPRDFIRAINDRVADSARNLSLTHQLPDMARLLSIAGPAQWSERVAYPPAADWAHVGDDEFRESFHFFTQANGRYFANRPTVYEPLPPLSSNDPSLPIISKRRRR